MPAFCSDFPMRTPSMVALACGLCCSGAVWAQTHCLASVASDSDCKVTIQELGQEHRQFGNIEVTGVTITSAQAKEAHPVQVLDRRLIERSPATHLGELLQHLPTLLPRDAAGLSGSMEVAAVHGDAAGTLVLVNGQRLPTAGRPGWTGAGQGVDLRFLPLSAIERIEVDTPGASSALGSDGITGIVNIVTRRNTTPALGAEYLAPANGQSDGRGLNVAWGTGHPGTDGYAMQLHAAVSQRTPMMATVPLQTLRAAPVTTRQQWFLAGEWRVGPSWNGFGHLLGTHESPPNVTTGASLPGWTPADIARGTWPQGLTEQQSMHQWQLGLKGPWQPWDVTASVASGQDRHQQPTYFGARTHGADPGPPSLQAMPSMAWQHHHARLQTLSVQAVRELDDPPQGPRTLGLGWHWRQESLATQHGPPNSALFEGQRQQWALHAEVKTPVAEQHELTVSARHDHYSDVGEAQTGELAWKWRPQKKLMVRASWGSGFRAPGLDQRSTQVSQTWLIWDPVHQSELLVRRTGQTDLKAEQSTRTTWGFRLEPHPRWTLGADLWRIDVRQAIGYPGPAALQAAGQLREDASGSYLDSVATNLGRTRKQGIDYDSEWRVPSDAGLFRLSLKGTLYLKSTLKQTMTGQTVSDLGHFSGTTPFVTPRHKMVSGISLERGDWVIMSGLRYRSAYREALLWPSTAPSTATPAEQKVPAYWRLDLGAQWRLNRQLSMSAWVLDIAQRSRLPDLSPNMGWTGTATRSLEDTGRTLKLKLIYKL